MLREADSDVKVNGFHSHTYSLLREADSDVKVNGFHSHN